MVLFSEAGVLKKNEQLSLGIQLLLKFSCIQFATWVQLLALTFILSPLFSSISGAMYPGIGGVSVGPLN